MFWGLVVQPNKKYSKTVSTPFHVSQAVLDVTSTQGDADVQLILKSDKVDYILCILNKSGTVQVPLNLIFSEGDEISFRSVGGTVHLTGYLVDEQNFPELEEAESSDADEEVPTLVAASKQKGKQQVAQESSSENENSDDSQDEGSDDDDNEVVEEDSDEEEEDDSDEEIVEPPPKIAKTNGMPNGVSKKEEKKRERQNKVHQQFEEIDPPGVKTITGGVKIEDIREGKGAVAKNGKKVQVYYEGRFKTTNKIFDKTNTGKGFEFILGKNNVIKGWDVGILGMRAGGKRRITCPPIMAYGQKGSPPAIPTNATLVFDVELRNVV